MNEKWVLRATDETGERWYCHTMSFGGLGIKNSQIGAYRFDSYFGAEHRVHLMKEMFSSFIWHPVRIVKKRKPPPVVEYWVIRVDRKKLDIDYYEYCVLSDKYPSLIMVPQDATKFRTQEVATHVLMTLLDMNIPNWVMETERHTLAFYEDQLEHAG